MLHVSPSSFLPRFAGEVAVAKRLTEGVAASSNILHRCRHPLRLTSFGTSPAPAGEEEVRCHV
jgi:hypothetical protein